VKGRTDVTPTEGMGIGAITGVVLTGALARFTPSQAPSRVLLVDLSAGLGALTGAAVASPLVFGDSVGPTRNRLWLSSIALGTFVGAGIGVFTTRAPAHDAHDGSLKLVVEPFAGVIAQSTKPDGSAVPATGGGIRGVF
jgi:ABC-type Fe3+-siderophore transport system permease subunit